jgi:hypothetical protein
MKRMGIALATVFTLTAITAACARSHLLSVEGTGRGAADQRPD